jgi:hypothetical protein
MNERAMYLVKAFVAGFVSTLVFHQGLLTLLHLAGALPRAPYDLAAVLERIHPAGGWHPDPGGLIHWWPRGCFPCCGAPDDYCRKGYPRVCWPPYPPYYIWGPPEICHPQGNGPRDCNKSH